MKVLVFGAGAIGSALGGFLSKEHEVTLLGRSWHLEAIRTRGLQVEGIWGRHRFRNFHLETQAPRLFRSQPFFHLILVTVKSFDTEAVARFLRGRISRETLVLSIQNGIGNIEILHRFLPPDQVLGGRVITGVEIQPGRIKVTVSADKTRIGETVTKRVTGRTRALAQIFERCGLPTEAVPDVEAFLWAKLVYNCALNPLASLVGVPYGFLSEHESTRFLMDEIIREVYDVAEHQHVKMNPKSASAYRNLFYRALVPRTYEHHPSMLQDLRRGKQTEIDAMNGAVVRLAKSLSIPTPLNELMTELILGQEGRPR